MAPAPEPLDPRAARSRRRVLDAALELLREDGASGCTIEAVAARSGVAKTTIYRQFADREDLLFSLMEELRPPAIVVDTGSVLADVEACLLEIAAGFDREGTGCLVATMIELAEHSERGAELAADFGARRRRQLAARLQAAVAAGEMRDDVDVDMTVSHLVGPIFYRRFLARLPVSPRFVKRSAAAVLNPLLRQPPAASRARGGSARRAG